MDDKLKLFELNGRWSVGFDNTEIVAFAGPHAQARAERQRSELTQLLSVIHWPVANDDSRELNHDGVGLDPLPGKTLTSPP
jgi:hypothetical protein